MKRLSKYKRPDYGIKKIFPILTSYECEICGYECRFMRMWDIIIGFWRGFRVHKLICCKCMPNKNDVIIWANKDRSDTKTRHDKWKLKPPQGGSGVPCKQKLPELEVNIPMPNEKNIQHCFICDGILHCDGILYPNEKVFETNRGIMCNACHDKMIYKLKEESIHGLEGFDDEPIFHSRISDELDEDHKDSEETLYCLNCDEMLHAFNNECMQPWFETKLGNFCIPCFLKIFDDAI